MFNASNVLFLILRNLALAVSGGSDSMALAFLCKQLISERLIPGLVVKPFIVDHLAREGSTEEAHEVAGWLRELGTICDDISHFNTCHGICYLNAC